MVSGRNPSFLDVTLGSAVQESTSASPLNRKDSEAYICHHSPALWGAFPLLVLGPVFKTGEGSGNRLLVGSIPMRSRQQPQLQ